MQRRRRGRRFDLAAAADGPQYSPPPARRRNIRRPRQCTIRPAAAICAAAAPAAAPVAPRRRSRRPAPTRRRADAFDPALNPNAPGAPRPLGASTDAAEPPPAVRAIRSGAAATRRAARSVEHLSAPQAGAAPGGASAAAAARQSERDRRHAQAALPPSNTPKDEYDLAYGYVLHKDYDAAAETFRDFLHKYPSDRLTPEAQYWLGESLFQAQAISRRRRIVPRGLDQIRDHRARARRAVAARPIARRAGREGSRLRLAGRSLAQISARFDRA